MRKGMCFLLAVLMIFSISLPCLAASFDDDGVLRLVNRDVKITKNYAK